MVNVPVGVLAATLLPVVVALVAVAAVTGWFRRAAACEVPLRRRVWDLRGYVGLLVAVLAFNALVRPRVDDVSTAFGIQFTNAIYAFEGHFVAHLQALTPEPLFVYYSAVYIVGYVLLLAFPPIAYAVLDDDRHVATLLVAYAVNYFLGALCYIVVVAHGPRNFRPELFEQPLYASLPDVMYITSAVNTNTNVFPSLHASMAVTVLLFAVFTREEYPRWLAITAVLVPSVVVATMALGIHWLTDVVAGVALAFVSVGVARWAVARVRGEHEPYHRPVEPVQF